MSEKLSTYTFLPWLRQGMASKIAQQDNLGTGAGLTERASVKISVQVNTQQDFVSEDVKLVGPGDVVGISPRVVVRTEPLNWTTDFEPNYLAFIEFYDEDFPWRYTPARAVEKDPSGTNVNNPQLTKLRPWIFLLILEEDEFKDAQSPSNILPTIQLESSVNAADILPPADQTWAWAHVHVNKDLTADNTRTTQQVVDALETEVRTNPDQALSRLMSPRKLKPMTGYHAFLIPAFEVGRLAGLGQSTAGQDALKASWGAGQTEYPTYYRWYFRTGERGDFEYLVNLLEARPVDKRVGIRDMDMQVPEFNATGMTDQPGDEPVMGLEGALKSPDTDSMPQKWPPDNTANYPQFLKDLDEMVNLQDDLLQAPAATGHPDPIISPPLYGRWHALVNRLNVGQTGWVNELNQDPRYRVPGGFGTNVVKTNQEDYMQRSWQQLGDVLAANQKIRQVQLAISSSQLLFSKHFLPLDTTHQVALTQQIHNRVLGSDTTIAAHVQQSRLHAALEPVFRRITRPRGAFMRKLSKVGEITSSEIVNRLNDGIIRAAPEKTAPENQISLGRLRETFFPGWIPNWLRKIFHWRYTRFVLLLLVVILLVLLFLFKLGAFWGVVTGIMFLSIIFLEWLRRRLVGLDRFSEEQLTTEAVEDIPPRPDFMITEPGEELPAGIDNAGATDSIEAANFRRALVNLHARFETELPKPVEIIPLDLDAIASKLTQAVEPMVAIPKRTLTVVKIPDSFKYLRPYETIVPVMAHPVLSDPMYKALRNISSELLIPNLDLIPNNTITLLETNPRFIESYMVGLNHEMARELLWREYPTDQRGSYFRQFWDVSEIINRDPSKDKKTLEEELRDITPLNTWGNLSTLGAHENRPLPTGGEPGENRLVLVIRGDLLKRYPTAVIYAQKAKWVDDPEDNTSPPRKIRVLDESNPNDNLKEPIFKAEIEPDLRFLGFNLTASVVKGDPTPPTSSGEQGNPGWFFVIQERPGEPRFGLDIDQTTPPTPTEWNDLAWNHFGDPATIKLIDVSSVPNINITDTPDKEITWGSNAADMAYIFYQVPVMVAVHADDMLNST